MGRFDALTHIEETPPKPNRSPDLSSTTTKIKQNQPTLIQNDVEKSRDNSILLANQQASKPASKKTDLLANQRVSKETNQQTTLPTNTQTSNVQTTLSTKEKKKYGTYLREESISAIQVHAIRTKRKDHEVLQQAVDQYFEKMSK